MLASQKSKAVNILKKLKKKNTGKNEKKDEIWTKILNAVSQKHPT